MRKAKRARSRGNCRRQKLYFKSLNHSGEARTGFICISCGVLMATHEVRARQLASRVPALAVALIALTLFLHPVDSNSWRGALYESLLVPPAISLVLLFSLERGPWLRAVLCSKPFQAVGVTSYGIYLWQQFFTVRERCFLFGSHVAPLLLPLLFFVVPLSSFLIEKPAMRYGRSLSQRAREASTGARATEERLLLS